MEILAKTSYQDVYRITDGVLLIVNKFKYKRFGDDNHIGIVYGDAKKRSYRVGCQKWLKILTEDYQNPYEKWCVLAGQVLYQDKPVEVEPDESKWEYQLKTTGEMFSGNTEKFKGLLESIIELVNKEQSDEDSDDTKEKNE